MKNRIGVLTVVLALLLPNGLWADDKGGVVTLERVVVGNAYVPKVMGLFIGIQDYDDPVWHDLKYPRNDVKKMVDFFSSGKALDLDYRLVLTKPHETTRDYILNHALETFAMKNSSSEDVVIVYISSHGTLTSEQFTVIKDGHKLVEPRKVPYILTSDAREGRVPDSAIALHKLLDWFEHLASSRKVLILDMCHSGIAGKSQLSPDQARHLKSSKGMNYIPLEDSSAAFVLASCPMGSSSFEDDQLKNSVYTYFLLEGMRTADLNGDGAVSISEAHNYAIDKTRTYTWEHKHYKQVPTTYSKILGKDPLIVYGKPEQPGKPMIFSYTSANQGVEVFVDGAYKGALPKGITLDPGHREVAMKYSGKVLYETRIEARKGADYMLPDVAALKPESASKTTVLLLLEAGQRGYHSSGLSDELLPASPLGGLSVHWLGVGSSWLGVSAGVNYSSGENMRQIGGHLGVKWTTPSSRLRLAVGPDVLFLSLSYDDAFAADQNVDANQSFLAPGAEGLLSYATEKGMVFGIGLSAHFMPYQADDGSHDVWTNQGVVTLGLAF